MCCDCVQINVYVSAYNECDCSRKGHSVSGDHVETAVLLSHCSTADMPRQNIDLKITQRLLSKMLYTSAYMCNSALELWSFKVIVH